MFMREPSYSGEQLNGLDERLTPIIDNVAKCRAAMLGDPTLAEDLSQGIHVVLLEKLSDGPGSHDATLFWRWFHEGNVPDGQIRTHLMNIARNLSKKWQQRGKTKTEPLNRQEAADSLQITDSVEKVSLRDLISQVLSECNDEQKATWLLTASNHNREDAMQILNSLGLPSDSSENVGQKIADAVNHRRNTIVQRMSRLRPRLIERAKCLGLLTVLLVTLVAALLTLGRPACFGAAQFRLAGMTQNRAAQFRLAGMTQNRAAQFRLAGMTQNRAAQFRLAGMTQNRTRSTNQG